MTIALALLATATAIGIAPIPRDQGFCRTDQSHYCHEWKLLSGLWQRLVARGDEDGIEYTFLALGARGRYRQPVRIHPMIRDADHPGLLFWGYAWDIRDIALAADGQSLLASFTHTACVTRSPALPAVRPRRCCGCKAAQRRTSTENCGSPTAPSHRCASRR